MNGGKTSVVVSSFFQMIPVLREDAHCSLGGEKKTHTHEVEHMHSFGSEMIVHRP